MDKGHLELRYRFQGLVETVSAQSASAIYYIRAWLVPAVTGTPQCKWIMSHSQYPLHFRRPASAKAQPAPGSHIWHAVLPLVFSGVGDDNWQLRSRGKDDNAARAEPARPVQGHPGRSSRGVRRYTWSILTIVNLSRPSICSCTISSNTHDDVLPCKDTSARLRNPVLFPVPTSVSSMPPPRHGCGTAYSASCVDLDLPVPVPFQATPTPVPDIGLRPPATSRLVVAHRPCVPPTASACAALTPTDQDNKDGEGRSAFN